ncbi:uncharacterized protein [Prorops nasuta]|uniref:uncharacterized protein n=1 Tax=Prorops nasuta TaxID=863751 RepID=UPI0034CEA953
MSTSTSQVRKRNQNLISMPITQAQGFQIETLYNKNIKHYVSKETDTQNRSADTLIQNIVVNKNGKILRIPAKPINNDLSHDLPFSTVHTSSYGEMNNDSHEEDDPKVINNEFDDLYYDHEDAAISNQQLNTEEMNDNIVNDYELNDNNNAISNEHGKYCCSYCKAISIKILKKQNEIIQLIKNTSDFSNDKENTIPSINQSDKLVDLINFDQLLSNDNKCVEFKKQVGSFGGKNIQKATSNVMSAIMSDSLATKCTWSGQTRNTFCISKCTFPGIIINILQNQYKCTKSEVEEKVKEWLRRAGDRIKSKDLQERRAAAKRMRLE